MDDNSNSEHNLDPADAAALRQRRGPGKKLTPRQRARLDDLIKRKPVTGMTDDEIARKMGCSRDAVSRRKKALAVLAKLAKTQQVIAEELKQPETYLKQALLEGGGELPRMDAQQVLDAFPGAEVLTPDELMRFLSIRIQNAPASTTANLINALENIRGRYAAQDQVGPPPPATEAERLEWLCLILKAVGLRLTNLAVDAVWGKPPQGATHEDARQTQADSNREGVQPPTQAQGEAQDGAGLQRGADQAREAPPQDPHVD